MTGRQKAGVRARADSYRRADRDGARAAWEAGAIVPHRITMALDLADLYGPEVDAALEVPEPTVDCWEAGTLYPTWPQLLALAALTRFPVGFFAKPHIAIDGPVFICDRSSRRPEPYNPDPPVVAFTHQALVTAGIREPLPGNAQPR